MTRRRLGAGLALLMAGLALGLAAFVRPPAPAAAVPVRAHTPPTRYGLAHGCFRVQRRRGPAFARVPLRFQPAALAQYLLYTPAGGYLQDSGAGIQASPAPTGAAVWRMLGTARRGFILINAGTGLRVPVRLSSARGCASYPEAQLDARGRTFHGASPMGWTVGTIDAHVHVTGFELFGGEWHCGRPWSPFGAPWALPDCAGVQQGTNGQVESFEDYGSPSHPHDTVGWPTFHDWPAPTDLAEEGTYYTAMKRAWMAGLRVMVTQLVDNEALCTVMSQRRNPCNDMQSVRIQAADLHALQDYIDAQSGGPGKGFFRIVTNPFQARQVINQGKLAVVEGIEVSHLFDCGEYLGTPQCDQAQVDAGLREVRALGVSTFFPIHKFDNAFGGTKMDAGETGVIVNQGNHLETGHYWNIETCPGPAHDKEQMTVPVGGGLTQLLAGPVGQSLGGGVVPVYPPPPHCNTRGLTPLGAYLLNRMIQQHFIVELDHMDVRTSNAALSILEAHHYSGVVSAHSWDSPEQNPRIYNLGGFVTPIAGASPASFIAQWRATRTIRNPRYLFGSGFGYGADMNGLAEQSQPAANGSGHPIAYPFSSYDGRVRFAREVWGRRTFDLNRDGVANYGMYPDWLQELRTMAGRPILADMFNGAEAYLEMWERAYGVPDAGCLPAARQFSATGLGRVRLGSDFRSLLLRAGQPTARPGRVYRYCLGGGGSLRAVFGARGRVELVLASAPGLAMPKARAGHGVSIRRLGRQWVGVTNARGAALAADERAAFA